MVKEMKRAEVIFSQKKGNEKLGKVVKKEKVGALNQRLEKNRPKVLVKN